VGRSADVSAVGELLTSARLVRLTGVPGVGKTRLALQVARRYRHRFRGGVWFVELATAGDSALVAHTIAHAIGLGEDTGGDPLELISEHLRERRALLVLDNCEHLVRPSAVLVATLLRQTRSLRILITSRHVLQATGEHLWQVQPMPATAEEPDAVGEAVELFTQRARAVVPTFELTPANKAQVAAACRRLDGIPLALELGAACLRTMSLSQLLTGLDQRLELPSSGPRELTGRHETLRAALDWSFELCEPAERRLWARLSFFAGSFDLQAIEEVCTGGEIAVSDLMDLVDALIGKSLLAATVVAARVRYRMLETLRQYGREKLDRPGEMRRLMAAYTQRYLRMAEREWFGPGQHALLEALEEEHDNVRAALHALDTPLQAERAQRLSGALWFYWIFAGRLAEGRFWLDRALALSTAPTRPRAQALWANSLLAAIEGNRAAGERMADDAYALAEQLDDTTTLTRAMARQATAAVYRGDPDAAVSPALRALARNAQMASPDDVTEMLGQMGLGMARFVQGDLVAAAHACRRADEVSRSRGDQLMRVFTLNLLARIEWRAGDLGQAAAHLAEVLRASTAPASCATSIEQLAWVACARRDHVDAALLLGSAHHVRQRYRLARIMQTAYFDVWHRDCRSRVTSALGEQAFDDAFRRGSRLRVADIIAYTQRCATHPPVSGANDEPAVPVLDSDPNNDLFAAVPWASP
jgi:predicted ATPase